jgi:PAS domain S-box-containing protein
MEFEKTNPELERRVVERTSELAAHNQALKAEIDERKRVEHELQESEVRLEKAQRLAHVGYWERDLATERLVWSDETYRIFGLPPQERALNLASLLEMIHPDDRAMQARAVAAAIKDARAYDLEYRIVRPNGEVRVVRSQGEMSQDGAAQATRFFGTVQDITERKQTEEALCISENNFRNLAEKSLQGIVIFQEEGMVYVNPSHCAIQGYPAEELKSMSKEQLFALVHPLDRPLAIERARQRLAGEKLDPSVELRIVRKDGSTRWIQSFNNPIEFNGRPALLSTSIDITERREIAEQLRHSHKMEAIGQLAGGVAHDFNNILTVMIMQCEVLGVENDLSEEVRVGLQQIQAAAERAADLTRQLLLFGRQQVMRARNLDLNEAVTSIAQMLRRIIGEDVQLQLHLHSGPLRTEADPGMVDQVLMNLAVNARDAMPKGGTLIIETMEDDFDQDVIHLNPEASPGKYVCVSVDDSGGGIPAAILPRIFEPFFTTKEPGKGTGLGLATVFGIVKQHGGFLKVENEPGRGAKFRVFLPASSGADGSSAPAAMRPQPRKGTESILLVEDEDVVRTLTRITLELHGYRVLDAPSGVEALKLWDRHRDEVALLLTDMVMPAGISGSELAARLRKDKPELNIVFTSGYSTDLAGRRLELQPGEQFLQKPFLPDQLLKIIRLSLDR